MTTRPACAILLTMAVAAVALSFTPLRAHCSSDPPALPRIRMEEMTWKEIKRAIESGYTTVVFAAGSMEQHGPHTPLAVDSMNGHEVAFRVARKLGQALQGPTITLGESSIHMSFAGTIALSPETFRSVVRDYCRSLVRHGFREIIIIPSHGGNYPLVDEVRQELAGQHPNVTFRAYPEFTPLMNELNRTVARLGMDPDRAGSHAGEHETSMTLFLRPELVNRDEMEMGFLGDLAQWRAAMQGKDHEVVSGNGATGDPFPAEASHGDAYFDTWANYLVERVRAERKSANVEE